MRLLNASTYKLHEFKSDIPPFAILSHCWAEDSEEVLFEDIGTPRAERKAGFRKIKGCCTQALEDGLQYVWIDTCSIDKTSSTELSEAINSMFRWYAQAHVCYVYLEDVQNDGLYGGAIESLPHSKWFTRGWTLQELIAPRDVVFYTQSWTEIGTKMSLLRDLHKITNIGQEVLMDSRNIFKTSIAQRMYWASKRETTRIEDVAYCLLGLFDVNMPLLYGEGSRAFYRLQLELLAMSNDHSIFAWKDIDDSSQLSTGILASHPSQFQDAGRIVVAHRKNLSDSIISMTNIGLSIRLPILFSGGNHIAILDCLWQDYNREQVGIFLVQDGADHYSRTHSAIRTVISEEMLANAEVKDIYISARILENGWPSQNPWAQNTTLQFRLHLTTNKERQLRLQKRVLFSAPTFDSEPKVLEKQNMEFEGCYEFNLAPGGWVVFEVGCPGAGTVVVTIGRLLERVWSDVIPGQQRQDLVQIGLSVYESLQQCLLDQEEEWIFFGDRIPVSFGKTEMMSLVTKRLPTTGFAATMKTAYKIHFVELPPGSYYSLWADESQPSRVRGLFNNIKERRPRRFGSVELGSSAIGPRRSPIDKNSIKLISLDYSTNKAVWDDIKANDKSKAQVGIEKRTEHDSSKTNGIKRDMSVTSLRTPRKSPKESPLGSSAGEDDEDDDDSAPLARTNPRDETEARIARFLGGARLV